MLFNVGILRRRLPFNAALVRLKNQPQFKRLINTSKPVYTNGHAAFNETTNKKTENGIKQLIQKYGYSALIVYVGVSLITVSSCFFGVHSIGEEKARIYINRAKRLFGYGEADENKVVEKMHKKKLENSTKNAKDWKNSHLLAEFLIAYGLYKSLIFIRIPIVAAATPYAARIFQRLGFTKIVGNNRTVASKYVNGQVPRQKKTTGQKWFNGLM
ncbi:hypothetical protein KAFR_0I00930 [Kazachstania africana CBS 2517]|uniref:DUF1279 domain-containing protein n=1 Tax=Kazachstania africana (strain ATCC 22294 / BCRC 22015 / CBS 2517 / CECT 1963 / NBRC 1671 / NRRL Y-8276) TaxID=1071382 RepID=H2AZS4_KAZAF|nr:hypothetical protein KAFR_0I00930 [Kazachstania africana CBS 2517]CCF59874.1 hypothetical protein KAFR_0I00930 [Kazachstania africana CBS 2517]